MNLDTNPQHHTQSDLIKVLSKRQQNTCYVYLLQLWTCLQLNEKQLTDWVLDNNQPPTYENTYPTLVYSLRKNYNRRQQKFMFHLFHLLICFWHTKHIIKQKQTQNFRYNADCPSLPRWKWHCPAGQPRIGTGDGSG